VASDATAHRVPRTLLSPTPDLLTDLRTRAAYSEGAGIHRIVPTAVAVPRGVEELQRLVRWAADSGRHLVPRGAGSGMAGGSVRHWVAAIEIIGADGEPRRVSRGEGSSERFGLSPEQRRIVAARFPKTRKNSAGYALNHFADSGDELDLLIGSEGTLAIVT